ncbi:hypothetical protein [Lentibacillus kimchii]
MSIFKIAYKGLFKTAIIYFLKNQLTENENHLMIESNQYNEQSDDEEE